jgi:hypothetical protein
MSLNAMNLNAMAAMMSEALGRELMRRILSKSGQFAGHSGR